MAPPWTLPPIAVPDWLSSARAGREAPEPAGGEGGRGKGEAEGGASGATEFLGWYSDLLGLLLKNHDVMEYVTTITGFSEHGLDHGLEIFSAAMSFIGQYAESTDQTTAGKIVDGAGAAAISVIMGKINPALPVVDGVVGYAFEHGLGIKGMSIDATEKTAWRAITTLGEGIITWDDKGMSAFHEKSMHGEYGPIFKAASEAGEYWADKGIVGGLEEFGSAVADLFD